MKNPILTTIITILVITPILSAISSIPLDGEWRFALDQEDVGESERWFTRQLSGRIHLPGDLASQGIGNPITIDTPWIGRIVDRSFFTEPRYAPYRKKGDIKIPFWLQPDRYYKGAVWFQREIIIPENWIGQHLVISLERPHWKSSVWLNEQYMGDDLSLSTPHVYDLGVIIKSGKHQLTVRIDNSMVIDIGENSHSVSDHTQGNWNGITGDILMRARSPVWLDEIRVFTDIAKKEIQIKALLRNKTGKQADGSITLNVEAQKDLQTLDSNLVKGDFDTSADAQIIELKYSLGNDAKLWDEFSPAVYRARLTIEGTLGGKPFTHESRIPFGLREVTSEGNQLLINKRKLYLRGTLECAIFPKTGHPPSDVESWRKIYRVAKAHGLNHLRFHSWCPPEAAFTAADEMGVYLQPEAASWPNQSTRLGSGKPVDAWLEEETKRILKAYGNHPSFILMAAGNEPGGQDHKAWLGKWVTRRQQEDPRRFYTSGSGWPELPENDYHVTPKPRIQAWGQGLKSRINALPPETLTDYRDFIAERSVPVLAHEIGQWCVYPNFDEIKKYTGYLKPRNFEIYRDWLVNNHMGDQAHDFLMASGKLQALCYKEEIESALRTPSMGGFQLLDLHDFPGQGTALVGILDPFWEEKGYITADEFSRFCNSIVPLARMKKRVYTSDEVLHAKLELSHYGSTTLEGATPEWSLMDDSGVIVKQGTFLPQDLRSDGLLHLGNLKINLSDLQTPSKYTLAVGLQGTNIENSWDVWLYPETTRASQVRNFTVVSELDSVALQKLEKGETVLLQIPKKRVRGDTGGQVKMGFSSIFWNTAWTRGQAPHTLGILCDPKHPALSIFPTEFHSNWQWWYVVTEATAMILNDLPKELRPIVQVVDDWFQARRLGLVFEARIGKGRLLVTSVDLNAVDNPVVAQLRNSLYEYLSSKPTRLIELRAEDIRGLYK